MINDYGGLLDRDNMHEFYHNTMNKNSFIANVNLLVCKLKTIIELNDKLTPEVVDMFKKLLEYWQNILLLLENLDMLNELANDLPFIKELLDMMEDLPSIVQDMLNQINEALDRWEEISEDILPQIEGLFDMAPSISTWEVDVTEAVPAETPVTVPSYRHKYARMMIFINGVSTREFQLVAPDTSTNPLNFYSDTIVFLDDIPANVQITGMTITIPDGAPIVPKVVVHDGTLVGEGITDWPLGVSSTIIDQITANTDNITANRADIDSLLTPEKVFVADTSISTTAGGGTIDINTLSNIGTTGTLSHPVPVVSATNAGIMPASLYNDFEAVKTIVEGMEGGTAFVWIDDSLDASASQQDLANSWTSSGLPLSQGSVIESKTNGYQWVYRQTTWHGPYDVGVDTIATDTALGIVKGVTDNAANDGKVFVETDGTMTLVGYDGLVANDTTLMSRFDAAGNALSANKVTSNQIVSIDDSSAVPNVSFNGTAPVALGIPVTVPSTAASSTLPSTTTISLRSWLAAIRAYCLGLNNKLANATSASAVTNGNPGIVALAADNNTTSRTMAATPAGVAAQIAAGGGGAGNGEVGPVPSSIVKRTPSGGIVANGFSVGSPSANLIDTVVYPFQTVLGTVSTTVSRLYIKLPTLDVSLAFGNLYVSFLVGIENIGFTSVELSAQLNGAGPVISPKASISLDQSVVGSIQHNIITNMQLAGYNNSGNVDYYIIADIENPDGTFDLSNSSIIVQGCTLDAHNDLDISTGWDAGALLNPPVFNYQEDVMLYGPTTSPIPYSTARRNRNGALVARGFIFGNRIDPDGDPIFPQFDITAYPDIWRGSDSTVNAPIYIKLPLVTSNISFTLDFSIASTASNFLSSDVRISGRIQTPVSTGGWIAVSAEVSPTTDNIASIEVVRADWDHYIVLHSKTGWYTAPTIVLREILVTDSDSSVEWSEGWLFEQGVDRVWEQTIAVPTIFESGSTVSQLNKISTIIPAGTSITVPAYRPGSGNLSVYVDGFKCYPGSSNQYNETSPTTVTFTFILNPGDEVIYEVK